MNVPLHSDHHWDLLGLHSDQGHHDQNYIMYKMKHTTYNTYCIAGNFAGQNVSQMAQKNDNSKIKFSADAGHSHVIEPRECQNHGFHFRGC